MLRVDHEQAQFLKSLQLGYWGCYGFTPRYYFLLDPTALPLAGLGGSSCATFTDTSLSVYYSRYRHAISDLLSVLITHLDEAAAIRAIPLSEEGEIWATDKLLLQRDLPRVDAERVEISLFDIVSDRSLEDFEHLGNHVRHHLRQEAVESLLHHDRG